MNEFKSQEGQAFTFPRHLRLVVCYCNSWHPLQDKNISKKSNYQWQTGEDADRWPRQETVGRQAFFNGIFWFMGKYATTAWLLLPWWRRGWMPYRDIGQGDLHMMPASPGRDSKICLKCSASAFWIRLMRDVWSEYKHVLACKQDHSGVPWTIGS